MPRSSRYLEALSEAAPDRSKLVRYGESFEGRELVYLIISSPETMARLDEAREENLRLADPRSLAEGEAEELIERAPAVVWLAYSVHGDESSSSDAALVTAYSLLADTPPRGEGAARRGDRRHRPDPEPRRPGPLRRLSPTGPGAPSRRRTPGRPSGSSPGRAGGSTTTSST